VGSEVGEPRSVHEAAGLFASYFFPGLGFLVIAWLSWRYVPRYRAWKRERMLRELRLPVNSGLSDWEAWEASLFRIGAAGVPALAGCFLIIAA
jgi:hypothetical protein